jgi:NADH:ubiquinone oxidoreductase subunit 5 (subunit L)/multisubunit Na+/H+ antiporter MnhA subunit
MFQNDLKGLLAYSTISHLGLITLLLGLNSPLAAVAAVFHIMNHATFKASLFMAVGIIDHETGTRDMRRLTACCVHAGTGKLAMVACAAMAGVPLLNGFLSKEMFFAETVYISPRRWWNTACRSPPPWPASSRGVFAALYPRRLLRPARRATAAHAARATALDARAHRTAGAGLPGGRHRARPGGRALPGRRARCPWSAASCRNTAWRSGTASMRRS